MQNLWFETGLWLARNLILLGSWVGRKIGRITFPKLTFWKIQLSLLAWFWSLSLIFSGGIKIRYFMFWFVSFLCLIKDCYKDYYKKIMKTQAEKEKFYDSESSLGELFSKTDDLGRESLSPAAGFCSSTRKETALREKIELLK